MKKELTDSEEEEHIEHHTTGRHLNSHKQPNYTQNNDDDDEEDGGYMTPEPVVAPQHLQQMLQYTPPKKRLNLSTTRKKLPFDQEYIYDLAKTVTINNHFDHQTFSSADFNNIEQQEWFGSIYCDLSELKPFNRNYKDGIERYLQIIFTRYANKQYNEGLFIIRAEFGSDWFTPILQHPFCILRQRLDWNSGSDFDSFIAFYMGPNEQQFCQYFKNVGFIPGFNIWYHFY